MKSLNNRIAFLLLMVAGMFGVQNAVADTAIPLSVGDYLVTSTSETTGNINKNDGGNLGGIYKDATATFTLTNISAQDMVLTFLTGNDRLRGDFLSFHISCQYFYLRILKDVVPLHQD